MTSSGQCSVLKLIDRGVGDLILWQFPNDVLVASVFVNVFSVSRSDLSRCFGVSFVFVIISGGYSKLPQSRTAVLRFLPSVL